MDVSIGELARLTGISVRTIRYYSEIGLVPEAGRTRSGYRRYDADGLARLELVRALRALGFDLATVAEIAGRQRGLEEAARAQAAAVEAHIRQLTLRRAVLRAVAGGITGPEEVHRMTAFARASADEVRRIMEDFLAAVFAGHEGNPFAARMRSAIPSLPEEPAAAQIDAWVELARLVGDQDFRNRIREMLEGGEQVRSETGVGHDDEALRAAGQAVVDRAGAALAAGIDPRSAAAVPIVDSLVAGFLAASAVTDSADARAQLLGRLDQFGDARVERYWQLIGIINGWPAFPARMPAYEWFATALRANLSPGLP